jgi:hypothetical protein
MNDRLKEDLFSLPTPTRNDAISNAIKNVKACKPVHPIFGTPAEVNFADAHSRSDGKYYVRFRVSALADISLVYLVDNKGNLERAYLFAT